MSTATAALAETIADHLAKQKAGISTTDLAAEINVHPEVVKAELLDLEGLGIVFRTGRTRGTRWWLG